MVGTNYHCQFFLHSLDSLPSLRTLGLEVLPPTINSKMLCLACLQHAALRKCQHTQTDLGDDLMHGKQQPGL